MIDFNTLYNKIPQWKRDSLSKCYQNPKYHPEIWVDKHIEQVFNNVLNFFGEDIDLLMCAIFHDITKDISWQRKMSIVKNEDGHYVWSEKSSNIGHDQTALPYIKCWQYLFPEYNVNWDKVYEVCKYHLRAHQYLTNELKNANKRKQFESLTYFEDIMKFEKCDSYNPLKQL